MLNFNELNKKKDIPVFTKADLSIGNQIKLVVPFSTYKIGSVFTVIGDSLTEKVIKFSGIGETFFKDSTGLIIQINGNKSILSSMFENIVQPIVRTEPKPIHIPVITPKNGENGVRGDKGDRGDIGFSGLQGIQGLQGDRGEKGEKGDKGDIGERGETGHTGWTGDKGLQGVDGSVGPKGDKGDRGEQGIKGDTGEQGIKGDKGDTGEQGLQGIQGLSGKDGSDGSQGIQGLLGEKGEQGIQGLQGVPGKDGKDGEPGEQGISGVNGKDGKDGEQGKTGDSGILEVSYPLKLDNKSLSIEQQFFADLAENSSKGTSAQGGGGSNVAIYKDGERYINVVKSINFTGDGVDVTKNGNKLTVNINSNTSNGNTPGPTMPYVQGLTISDGELIVTYGDSSTENLGDILGVDGGTF